MILWLRLPALCLLRRRQRHLCHHPLHRLRLSRLLLHRRLPLSWMLLRCPLPEAHRGRVRLLPHPIPVPSPLCRMQLQSLMVLVLRLAVWVAAVCLSRVLLGLLRAIREQPLVQRRFRRITRILLSQGRFRALRLLLVLLLLWRRRPGRWPGRWVRRRLCRVPVAVRVLAFRLGRRWPVRLLTVL